MQGVDKEDRKEFKFANELFLSITIFQLIVFSISMCVNRCGHKRCYLVVSWVEEACEIWLLFANYHIGKVLKVPMSNFLLITGAILNLGVVIFESYRECKNNDLTCIDETQFEGKKGRRNLRNCGICCYCCCCAYIWLAVLAGTFDKED